MKTVFAKDLRINPDIVIPQFIIKAFLTGSAANV